MTTNPPSPAKSGSSGGKSAPLFKFLIPLGLLLLGVTAVLFALRSQVGRPPDADGGAKVATEVGATAPDFSIKRLSDGKILKLSQILTGPTKVVMVNFWATWCEACMVEMPSIVRLYKQYASRGFDVVAVSLDENASEVVPETAKNLGMQFGIYVDNEEQEAASTFNVSAIPLTVILGRDRKILYIEPGEREWDGSEEKAQLEKWLGR